MRGYSWHTFSKDLVAGLVALPLVMAFAISSGAAPGTFVVVVSGIVVTHEIDGTFMCAIMAGVVVILLGVTGLGTAVKYTPKGRR